MKHTPFDFDSLSLLAVGLPESLKSLRYAGRFDEELREIDRLLADDTHPVYEPILKARLELEKILAAGVVGQGGAAFPTAVKLTRNPNKPIDTLLVSTGLNNSEQAWNETPAG
ncbi:MAG: hypothetical protein IKX19_05740, partial [Clostridia bacterium]|nr:hypothetical protein [Clostridia bacterium]